MEYQVASVAKTCYYQIRNIGQIRSCITSDACKILVHALVTLRLGYCNALLYGLPQTMLKRLQRVQNCAARLICRRKKHDHVTPLLRGGQHYVPRPVPMFPGTDVPRTYVPRYLCSPVPMFPGFFTLIVDFSINR